MAGKRAVVERSTLIGTGIVFLVGGLLSAYLAGRWEPTYNSAEWATVIGLVGFFGAVLAALSLVLIAVGASLVYVTDED